VLTMFVRDSRTDRQMHEHAGNIMPPATTLAEA